MRKTPPAAPRFVAGFRHSVRRDFVCRLHSHPALEIVFHRGGSGLTRLPGRADVPFEPHTVIIYGPDIPHDQVMRSAGEDVCVQIEVPARIRRAVGPVLRLPAITEPVLVEELLSLSESPAPENDLQRTLLDHRAAAVLLSLLQLREATPATSADTPSSCHAAAAAHYMQRHFHEIGSLREISDHLGLSLDHLRHLFRRERKVTLIGFLTSLRLARAKFLLRGTGLPLKQVATLSGFANEYYFSTVFRRETGQPPAAYRREVSTPPAPLD